MSFFPDPSDIIWLAISTLRDLGPPSVWFSSPSATVMAVMMVGGFVDETMW